MGEMINGHSEKSRYYIVGERIGEVPVRFWGDADNNDLEYNVDFENGGIVSKLGNQIEIFRYKDSVAYDAIVNERNLYNSDADITLVKRSLAYQTFNGQRRMMQFYVEDYRQFAEAKTLVINTNSITFQTAETQRRQIIKDGLRKKINILNTEVLREGFDDLEAPETETLFFPGRNLFLETLFGNDFNFPSQLLVQTIQPNFISYPLGLNYTSHSNIAQDPISVLTRGLARPDVSALFYVTDGRGQTFEGNIRATFNSNARFENQSDFSLFIQVQFNSYSVEIVNGVPEYTEASQIILADLEVQPNSFEDVEFDRLLIMNPELSYEIVVRYLGASIFIDIPTSLTATNTSLLLEQDSVFRETNCKSILIHEFIERQMNLILGENQMPVFAPPLGRSELEQYDVDGEYGWLTISSGNLVRNVPTSQEYINTTLRETFDFLQARGLAMRFEEFQGSERLRIDYPENLFRGDILVHQFRDIPINEELTIDDNLLFSGVVVGAELSSPFEEIHGIDEITTETEWSIPKVGGSILRKTFKQSPATTLHELVRRDQFRDNATSSNRYDKDLIIVHVYRSGVNALRPVMASDYLDSFDGIYSPETFYNAMFIPSLMLRRLNNLLIPALNRQLDQFLTLSSQDTSNTFTTELNGVIHSETDRIPISSLNFSIFSIDIVKVEVEITDEIRRLVNGSTFLDGEIFNNIGGRYEYFGADRVMKAGFIQNIVLNDLAEIELRLINI